MKLKKILLLLFLISSVFSCGKKENSDTSANKEKEVKKEETVKTEDEAKKEETVEEQIIKMVNVWNDASSNADFDTLEKILGNKIEYTSHLSQKTIIFLIRRNFLQKILFMAKK